MRKQNWFNRIAQNQMDFGDLLFHGTGEPIEGELAPYSHGGILWVAENPATAQNYIPQSGGCSFFPFIDDHRIDDTFAPDQGAHYDMLRQMGFDLDVEWDRTGRAISWGAKNRGPLPKYRDVKNFIENTLGYQKGDYGNYCIKSSFKNGHSEYLPADYKLPGTLYIFTGKQNLKIMDLTGGHDEDDLTDPTYNKISWFEKAKAAGYDGVRINDYGQSKYWGNYGHKSIGLFESGLKKLQQEKVPATNFDWSDDARYRQDTDEYNGWRAQQKPVDNPQII